MNNHTYMASALRLADAATGTTAPNPAVGCVIVRNHTVVGQGVTQPGGRPHAEVMALQQAGAAARGATAYVTLEPCSHHGATPPCAEALIYAGIARVVIAAEDPNPKVSGRGIALLRAAGIDVTTGIGTAEATRQHAGFFSVMQRGRPHVTLKIASSMDGKIALANGESQWITGEAARHYGHWLRARSDAIITGIGTVLKDNPTLTCRLPGRTEHSPVRIVLDTHGKLPPESTLVQTADLTPVWHVTQANRSYPHVTYIPLPPHDLPALLKELAARGITRVLVEGGAQLATSFLMADLVDDIAWFHAPMILGNDALPAVGECTITSLQDAARWQTIERKFLGSDTLTLLQRNRPVLPQ